MKKFGELSSARLKKSATTSQKQAQQIMQKTKRETLNGWEVPLTLVKVVQNIYKGDLYQDNIKIDFQGCWQPLRKENLELKPEGQRSWEWYWVHAKTGTLNLETGDKVIFNGERYKVMSKKDYSLNGYVEYEVIKDYTGLDDR